MEIGIKTPRLRMSMTSHILTTLRLTWHSLTFRYFSTCLLLLLLLWLVLLLYYHGQWLNRGNKIDWFLIVFRFDAHYPSIVMIVLGNVVCVLDNSGFLNLYDYVGNDALLLTWWTALTLHSYCKYAIIFF